MTVFQVSSVFRVVDAFSLRPIPLNLLEVTTDSAQKVLRKQGGYLVFLGKEVPRFLEIRCPNYLPLTFTTENMVLGQEETLWLIPQDCEKISVAKKKTWYAVAKQGVKLAENLKPQEEMLNLFPVEGKHFGGRHLLLTQGSEREVVQLVEEPEPNLFRLATGVKGNYQKLMAQGFLLYPSEGEEIFVPPEDTFSLIDEKGKEIPLPKTKKSPKEKIP